MNTAARFVNVIRSLEGVSSKNEKISIISTVSNDPVSCELFKAALSPLVTFGVRNFELPSVYNKTDAPIETFYLLMESLATRELSGGAARFAITNNLAMFTANTAEILARVLLKDLKVRVAASIVNKAMGREVVPDFGVMLADKYDTKKGKFPSGPWLVEYKYDGMRLPAFVEGDEVRFFSRDGIEQENVPQHIINGCIAMRDAFGKDCVIDGEILGTSFKQTISAMKDCKKTKDRSALRFFVFDLVPLDAWRAQSYSATQMERRKQIEALLPSSDERAAASAALVASHGKLCTTWEQVMAFYMKMTDVGAEGVIIKVANAPYQWKRCKSWLKHKPVHTADLEICGYYEGDPGSEFEGTFGGWNLRGHLEDGTYIETNVGSGFKLIRTSDSDEPTRSEIWANPKKYIGLTAEVEYQEVTKAENKEHHALRFVVFKHIRHDK